ncbi:MAG: PRC-barrel domain-containing protein [Nanoarchaeota archaeon]
MFNINKKSNIIFTFLIIAFILYTSPAYAITAESTDYSVTTFATGITASNIDSDSFEGSVGTGNSGGSAESADFTADIGIGSSTVFGETTTTLSTSPAAEESSGESKSKTITLLQTCEYNWDCTPWSFCSDGKQTRECKNIGTCEGGGEKPKEEVSCSELLLDIVLKLKKIELTPDKTLKFGISLKETFGKEKVDVHVKYTLTDSNNNDIFNQIETLSIKGSLFYEKEITDIELQNGDYTLRVDVLYGNLQRAFAEQDFKVEDGKVNIDIFGNIVKNIREFLTAIQHKFNLIAGISLPSLELMLILLVIILAIALLIILRKKLVLTSKEPIKHLSRISDHARYHSNNLIGLVIEYLSRINNPIKYPSNSIFGLMNKKVYSEGGNYIGGISDVIISGNKIEGLKIDIDRKYNFKAKGIIIKYKRVKNVGDIIIIDEIIYEYLDNLNLDKSKKRSYFDVLKIKKLFSMNS